MCPRPTLQASCRYERYHSDFIYPAYNSFVTIQLTVSLPINTIEPYSLDLHHLTRWKGKTNMNLLNLCWNK